MSDIKARLHQEMVAAQVLKDNLRDALGDDAELLRDTIEGETSLLETIDRAVEFIAEQGADIEGIKSFIEKLSTRKARKETLIEVTRSAVLAGMAMAEITKRETPIATVSRKATPAGLQITDEAMIPAEFWEPQDPKLNKNKLKAALKEKQDIDGACLDNGGETLQIRWS